MTNRLGEAHPADTAAEVAHRLLGEHTVGARIVPARRPSAPAPGHAIGIVTLWDLLLSRGEPGMAVSRLIRNDLPIVHPGDDAAEVLDILAGKDATTAVVIDAAEEIVGLVTPSDIEHAILLSSIERGRLPIPREDTKTPLLRSGVGRCSRRGPPDVVADRFEIERLAGSGGMGSVYRATDRATGEPVAVKMLRGEADAEAVERFAREAQVLAELSHPAIVRYVAHGRAGGELYLAMEWLEGKTSRQRLAKKGLTGEESVALVRRVAEALGVAHRRGSSTATSSRATSSSSAATSTRVKVLDFGIARLRSSAPSVTQTGVAGRHAGLHGARAGARRQDARRARRRLLARLRALPVPHRRGPFAGDDMHGGARQDPARGGAARRRRPARRAARARRARRADAREAAAPSGPADASAVARRARGARRPSTAAPTPARDEAGRRRSPPASGG